MFQASGLPFGSFVGGEDRELRCGGSLGVEYLI